MKILHRTPEGWVVASKSVFNALDIIASKQKGTFSFHWTEIATILEQHGAIVVEEVHDRDLTKTTIKETRIRSLLNGEARNSDSRLRNDKDGWYIYQK